MNRRFAGAVDALIEKEPRLARFSRIERDVIARGIFTPVPDLRRKIMGYIRAHNDTAEPIRWGYNDPPHRVTVDTLSRVTGL